MGTGADLRADGVDPAHHLDVKIAVFSHRVIHPLAAFYKPRQNVVDVVDGERIIGAVIPARLFRLGSMAVPNRPLRVALATDSDIVTVLAPRDQHQNRAGLIKT